MVVKLEGKIDGSAVILERMSEDWWSVVIPRHLNGIYVLEMTATDAAGNQAFVARYIMTVDTGALRVSLRPCLYNIDLVSEGYYLSVQKNWEVTLDYDGEIQSGGAEACTFESKFLQGG